MLRNPFVRPVERTSVAHERLLYSDRGCRRMSAPRVHISGTDVAQLFVKIRKGGDDLPFATVSACVGTTDRRAQ